MEGIEKCAPIAILEIKKVCLDRVDLFFPMIASALVPSKRRMANREFKKCFFYFIQLAEGIFCPPIKAGIKFFGVLSSKGE